MERCRNLRRLCWDEEDRNNPEPKLIDVVLLTLVSSALRSHFVGLMFPVGSSGLFSLSPVGQKSFDRPWLANWQNWPGRRPRSAVPPYPEFGRTTPINVGVDHLKPSTSDLSRAHIAHHHHCFVPEGSSGLAHKCVLLTDQVSFL